MAKNSKEKDIFDKFIYHFDRVELIDVNGESPDFIIKYSNRVVGVEHTDMYWGDSNTTYPFQEMEGLQRLVHDKLLKKLEASSLPFFFVSLFFNSNQRMWKNNIDNLVNQLFDLIKNNIPKNNLQTTFDDSYGYEQLPSGINTLKITRLQDYDFFEVTIPTSSFLPSLKDSEIERVILKKDRKIKKYKERASELWLLISIETGSMATIYKHNEIIKRNTFKTGFDKIFIFKYNQNTIEELKVSSR